ncbi:hypothetical protein NE477_26000, partial [Blautia marasmi]|uniref:hypothetical protein n=1 Tax=Blautia marasmi TaxID=1917868 RepID=UPI00210AA1E6
RQSVCVGKKHYLSFPLNCKPTESIDGRMRIRKQRRKKRKRRKRKRKKASQLNWHQRGVRAVALYSR